MAKGKRGRPSREEMTLGKVVLPGGEYFLHIEKDQYTIGHYYQPPKGEPIWMSDGYFTTIEHSILFALRLKFYECGKDRETMKEFMQCISDSIEDVKQFARLMRDELVSVKDKKIAELEEEVKELKKNGAKRSD